MNPEENHSPIRCKTCFKKMGRSVRLSVFFATAALGLVLSGCSSLFHSNGEESYDLSEDVCTLSTEGDRFVCTMEFSPVKGDRCNPVPSRILGAFTHRMTTISLEMLYLDGEPGAKSPFQYNDRSGVHQSIQVQACEIQDSVCRCLLEYQHPGLKEIMYDSAGCRTGSVHRDHPLYFRSRSCN